MVVQELRSGSPGAKVQTVWPGMGAAEGGLQLGDVLVAIDGKDVTRRPFTEVG